MSANGNWQEAVARQLYNLYHVLNHANLFGGGYFAQARAMVDDLLAECSGRAVT